MVTTITLPQRRLFPLLALVLVAGSAVHAQDPTPLAVFRTTGVNSRACLTGCSTNRDAMMAALATRGIDPAARPACWTSGDLVNWYRQEDGADDAVDITNRSDPIAACVTVLSALAPDWAAVRVGSTTVCHPLNGFPIGCTAQRVNELNCAINRINGVCDSARASGFTDETCSACACTDFHHGRLCENTYTDDTTCNGLGTVDGGGGCACQNLFDGEFCQCRLQAGSGIVCTECLSGYAGPRCEYSVTDTCSGVGRLHGDGSIDSNGTCFDCAAGHEGPRCQYSRDGTCSGHGVPTEIGGCTRCDRGFAGPHCEYSDGNLCHDQGRALRNGTCFCGPGHAPVASGVNCTRACGDNGNVAAQPQPDGSEVCECRTGWTGANCECFDRTGSGSCSACGSGYDRVQGVCTRSSCASDAVSSVGFNCECINGDPNGEGCTACAPGFALTGAASRCIPVSADSFQGFYESRMACSGHGSPTGLIGGACDCSSYFHGPDCQDEHTDAADCNNGGNVGPDGHCACFPFHTGPRCAGCAPLHRRLPGSSRCTPDTVSCGPGEHNSNSSGGCTICESGTFAAGTQQRASCSSCPQRQTSPPGSDEQSDCFDEFQTGTGLFCSGTGSDSRGSDLAWITSREDCRTFAEGDPRYQFGAAPLPCTDPEACAGNPNACNGTGIEGNQPIVQACPVTCGTCGTPQTPCIVAADGETVLFFDPAAPAPLVYAGASYVPVCRAFFCRPNYFVSEDATATQLPQCAPDEQALSSIIDEEKARSDTAFFFIIVPGLAVSMVVAYTYLLYQVELPQKLPVPATCIGRWKSFFRLIGTSQHWLVCLVLLRIGDMATDWGFLEVNLGRPGVDDNAFSYAYAGDADAVRYACLGFCIGGTVLTVIDIWQTHRRYKHRNISKSKKLTWIVWACTLAVTLLEDVPQLCINVIYLYAIEAFDAVAIVSLVLSACSLVYNMWTLCKDCQNLGQKKKGENSEQPRNGTPKRAMPNTPNPSFGNSEC